MPVLDGFIGQAYVDKSIAVAGDRCVNLYPETVDADAGYKAGKAPMVLYRTPGLSLLQTLADSPCRSATAINGRCFAVAGSTLYELTSGATAVARGTVALDTNPAQFAYTSTQLLVLSAGFGYIFDLATDVLTAISASAFPHPATSCTQIDTYFIVLAGGTNQFFISGLLDGLSWSGLDFSSDQEPDNIIGIAESHGYLWCYGSQNSVVYQDSGGSSFPFTRLAGSQSRQGLAALNSLVNLDNTLLWLGLNENGQGVVYRDDGFLPARVSNYALEYAISQYAAINDAVAFAYLDEGHLFYVLSFPTANATWCYDVAEKKWHERGYWQSGTGSYSAVRGRFHAFCFGQHLVFDYANGNVYEMSDAYADDAGNPIRWLRAAPHLSDEEVSIFYAFLQIDMQVGEGIPGDIEPQVVLRYSDDGGFTWSSEIFAGCGKVGEYLKRVLFNRLGRARNRVFELSGSDPIPTLALIAAYYRAQKGIS